MEEKNVSAFLFSLPSSLTAMHIRRWGKSQDPLDADTSSVVHRGPSLALRVKPTVANATQGLDEPGIPVAHRFNEKIRPVCFYINNNDILLSCR